MPYPAVQSTIAERGAHLEGRIVLDITNPLNFETFDELTVPAASSATAQIAKALPDSRVIKAFNTNLAAILAAGSVGQTPTTVLIAGDDTAAKDGLSWLPLAACAPLMLGRPSVPASLRVSGSCRFCWLLVKRSLGPAVSASTSQILANACIGRNPSWLAPDAYFSNSAD